MFESIKVLDISFSRFTMHHLSAIVMALKQCVIEKLIIPSDDIYDDNIGDMILTQYYKGISMLNFILGFPLVIMNNTKVSAENGKVYASIFMKCKQRTLPDLNPSTLRKHKIAFIRSIVRVIEQLLDYKVYEHKLNLNNCNVELLEMGFYLSTLSLLPIIIYTKTASLL